MDHDRAAGLAQPLAPARPHGGGFVRGVGFLVRGMRMAARNPGLMVLGMLPALLAFVVLVAAFAALVLYVDNAVAALTPFMSGWDAHLRTASRLVLQVAITVVGLILSVLAYVTLTLLIGQPFYEAIAKRVEDQLGGVPGEVDVSFWRSLPRTVADSVRLGVLGLFVGIAIFAVGLIPVIGEIAEPVLGALVGGWLLALELTSVAFERRGLRFRHRRRALRAYRRMSVGFGVAVFVCFLIPLGAVIFMPAAVAGATLLSRHVLPLQE